jgi:hypothetical protein
MQLDHGGADLPITQRVLAVHSQNPTLRAAFRRFVTLQPREMLAIARVCMG